MTGRPSIRGAFVIALALATASAVARPAAACDADSIRRQSLVSHEGLAGRYGSGLAMLAVAPCGDGYAVQPVVSANPALLQRIAPDRYAFSERPERQIAFRRSAAGTVDAMTLLGSGQWLTRAAPAPQALDDLLEGRPAAAAARVGRTGGMGFDEAAQMADRVQSRLPSRRHAVASFMDALAARAPDSPSFHLAHGDALAASGQLQRAQRAFARAAASGAGADALAARLRMSGATEPSGPGGWALPFTLEQLLAGPGASEIDGVLNDWRDRRLDVSEVSEVQRQAVAFDDGPAEVAVLSFLANGARQFGLVILPADAAEGCCAVLLDIKGTTPDYAPLELGQPVPRSMRELAAARRQVLLALPGLRGERIVLGEHSFVSDGDRRDGWDGAADDARAMLTAVLKHYPQADPARVCAFGHSRGATVAMLAAERDARIGCVVAEAGPVDWFTLMPEDGWPLPVAVAEGLFSKSPPGAIGGQFIERFLAPVIEGSGSLAQARHRMLASSPLHFAARLPATLALYGVDDASVAVANGRALREALARSPSRAERRVEIQPAVGHDLDPVRTPQAAADFLRRQLRLARP